MLRGKFGDTRSRHKAKSRGVKILHVSTSLIRGGAEAAMYRLIVNNPDNTHVVVCLTGTGPYEELLKAKGIEVHLLDMKAHLLPMSSLLHLFKLVRLTKPDIVQTWMYHANLIGGLVARVAGVRRIFWGIRMSNPKRGKLKLSTQAVSKISAILGSWIPEKIISCATRATLDHIDIGYPESRMVTVYNGYDTNALSFQVRSRLTGRMRWGVLESDTVFGIVARWDKVKDHATLIKALAVLKLTQGGGWKCVFIGPGMTEANQDLVKLIKVNELEDYCILIGDQEDIPGIMSALDVHVLTSVDEGFPNVIAEAMSCKTPCVSTDAGDAKQIIGETGWIVPVGDHQAVFDSMYACLVERSSEASWLARKEKCRTRVVEQFSIEKMVSGFLTLWDVDNLETL